MYLLDRLDEFLDQRQFEPLDILEHGQEDSLRRENEILVLDGGVWFVDEL